MSRVDRSLLGVASSLAAALTVWLVFLSWGDLLVRPGRLSEPLAVAAVLVATVGALLRVAVRSRWWAVTLAQSGVLLMWLTSRWAGEVALLGVIPTPLSLRAMGTLLAEAVADSRAYPAPVPLVATAFPALALLVGCLALVLVDALACGLRRAELAGVPLLLLVTIPATIVLTRVHWGAFTASAVCFAVLLALQEAERVGRWSRRTHAGLGGLGAAGARPPAPATADRFGPGGLTGAGLVLGVLAAASAVLISLVVPTAGDNLRLSGQGGSGGAGAPVQLTNPIVDLRRDLVRTLRVPLVDLRTDDPDPSYLRMTVLDRFDGRAWSPGRRETPASHLTRGAMPPPEGLDTGVARQTYAYSFRATPSLQSQWLPTPFPAASIDAPGDWRYDSATRDVVSVVEGVTTARLAWEATGVEPELTANLLASAGPLSSDFRDRWTEVPSGLPAELLRWAEEATAGAETDYDKAVALQRWFRQGGGFEYSLAQVEGNGTDDLVRFLSPGDRTGYCEQFAAAMAVLARLLDVPARVAVGFLRPDRGRGDTWLMTSYDLHAWPEVFFQGAGWVRFEPTPSARTGSAPEWSRPGVDEPSEPGQPQATQAPEQPRVVTPREADPGTPDAATDSTGTAGRGWWSSAVLVVLLGLALTPYAARTTRRARRRRSVAPGEGVATGAEAAWSEIRDTVIDHGLPWSDALTVRGSALLLLDRARRGVPVTERSAVVLAMARLVAAVERARFGPPDGRLGTAGSAGLWADVELLTQAVRGSVEGSARRRASLWPRSVLPWGSPPPPRSPAGREDLWSDTVAAAARAEESHPHPDSPLRSHTLTRISR